MKYLKLYNESVRDLMKPKSPEEIEKSLKGISQSTKDSYLLKQCVKGDIEVVKVLLKYGANVNAKNEYRESALMIASGVRSSVDKCLDIVKYLVENGAKINIKNVKGNTALMIASSYGNLQIVKYLVENGADFSIKNNKNGWDALTWASCNNKTEVVNYLKQYMKTNESIRGMMKPKEDTLDIFKKLSKKRKIEVLWDALLSRYPIGSGSEKANYIKKIYNKLKRRLPFRYADCFEDLNDNQLLIVFKDIYNINESIRGMMKPKSKEDILKSLEHLSQGGKIDKILELDMSGIFSKEDIKELVLSMSPTEKLLRVFDDKISDIFTKEEIKEYLSNMPPRDQLHVGCERGLLWLVEDAIKSGVDIHEWNDYAVRIACEYGFIDIVKLLFSKGANIHSKNDSALASACEKGHTEIVKFLLDNGANIHTFNNRRNLIEASKRGYIEIVKILIDKGIDIHYDDDAAILDVCRYASGANSPGIFKLLLDAGADVHTNADQCLRTVIYDDRHIDTVKLLLDRGADINVIKDNDLGTKYNPKITELIKQYKERS